MKYRDGEVIGIEPITGLLIHWNATTKQPYTAGETLAEYGVDNLTGTERQRLMKKVGRSIES